LKNKAIESKQPSLGCDLARQMCDPTRLFSDVWQAKGLRMRIADVWQGKNLGEICSANWSRRDTSGAFCETRVVSSNADSTYTGDISTNEGGLSTTMLDNA
jgi:hypothetical protein